jgi:predicted SAM-dependent methyltransferase
MNNASTQKRQQRVFRAEILHNCIELGCGPENQWREESDREFTRIDCVDYGQDIIWNIEEGIPLPDNSASYIYASNVMEHLEDFIGVMNECHRVLKSNGELYIVVPHKEHEKALIPSHVRLFDKWTFDFFEYPAYADEYQSNVWKVTELTVNNRKDMHVKMQPIK